MKQPSPHPASITGGCLCGGIRYEGRFEEGYKWEDEPHICQCTQCRKFSGSIAVPFHSFRVSPDFTPSSPNASSSQDSGSNPTITFSQYSTFQEYESTPKFFRGFCSRCGSSISWRQQGLPEIEITAGTIDEKWLIGEERDDEGKASATDSFGQALVGDGGIIHFVANEIPGVTDNMKGKLYLEGTSKGLWKLRHDGSRL